MKLQSSCSNH